VKIDASTIKLTKSTQSHDTAIFLGIINKAEAMEYRISLIPDHTSKHFTHVKDILPALSGLASRMSRDRCGPYLAELWEHNLGRQCYGSSSEACSALDPRSTLPLLLLGV
jgi:hypothetical protein